MTEVELLRAKMGELADEQRRLREMLESEKEERAAAQEQRDAYHKLYLETLERCRRLERGLTAQKSERLAPDESQLSLAMMGMMLRNDADTPPEREERREIPAHTRSKPTGRKPLPEHLPRVDVVVVPHQVEDEGFNGFEQIGQESSETIERRPASVVIVRTFKPKFIRKGQPKGEGTEVFVAKSHPLPIERGIAGPGMLADSIVKRWDDHLPLSDGLFALLGCFALSTHVLLRQRRACSRRSMEAEFPENDTKPYERFDRRLRLAELDPRARGKLAHPSRGHDRGVVR